jgi:predicted acylesterase/phospholipase RssA/CRP-like cAMP-binding protein
MTDTPPASDSTSRSTPDEPTRAPIALGAGEVLFRQGDVGETMYAVIAGVLGVSVRQPDGSEIEVDRLAPGALVGEMAARAGRRRSATVYAINDAAVLEVSRPAAAAAPELTPEEQQGRWQRLKLAETLSQLLGPLDPAAVHDLQRELSWRHLSSGEVLIRQGDASDGMYIVINGRLRVAVELPDGTRELRNEILPGQTVGEYALLTDQPRSATVYAVRETNVVHMTAETFDRLSEAHPALLRHIARLVVERQTGGQRPPERCPQAIALVPTGGAVDAAAFARDLADALGRRGPVALLDAATFDARFGRAGAAQTERTDPAHLALVAWLDDLEAEQRFMLYVADPTPTAWTRRCLDHADRVLLLADPAGDPAPGPVEALLAGREIPLRIDLALWHPATTEWPSGTAAWLDARSGEAALTAHFHVRRDDAAHMARLARRLASEAVGLVFSGGGALAYADLGVYRALHELGIPIDYIGGSSMGAIIAGAAPLEMSLAEMEETAQYTADVGVFDWTLPLASLNRSENVTRIIRHAFGDRQIEDLWLPYFCVSTSMSLAEPVVHRRGTMWRAVRASMAIPGVYVPVVEDGNVLIDGGIMDNFPVGVMAALSDSTRIIGVHVSPYKVRMREYDYDTSLSGWRLLASRLNPFGRSLRAPSLAYVMMRAAEINGVRLGKEDEALTDLLILPDVSGFRNTDYDQWRAIAERGYDAALEPLRAWAETRLAPEERAQPGVAGP